MRKYFWVLAVCIAGCGARESTLETASDRPSVEVMHWLTSDRDAAALSVLREGLVDRGGIWLDAPMPGAGSPRGGAGIKPPICSYAARPPS